MIGPKGVYRYLDEKTGRLFRGIGGDRKRMIRLHPPLWVSAGSLAKGRHLIPDAIDYARSHPVMTPKKRRKIRTVGAQP
jgi:hypothetical protein